MQALANALWQSAVGDVWLPVEGMRKWFMHAVGRSGVSAMRAIPWPTAWNLNGGVWGIAAAMIKGLFKNFDSVESNSQ